jgi:hypothetical protein
MLGKLLCLLGFHAEDEEVYDGGPYAYKDIWLVCKRPGCKWRAHSQTR